jgi:hypothetical protein
VAKQVAYLGAHPETDIVLCGWRAFERDGVTVDLEITSLPPSGSSMRSC